jgi:hypothetical protein
LHIITVKTTGTGDSCKYIIVTRKSEEKSMNNSNSSKKDLEEREEARRRIFEGDPDISKMLLNLCYH